MSWLSGFLGKDSNSNSISVEVLLKKIENSSLPEEKKKSINILKDISEKSQVHQLIGNSFDSLFIILKTEKNDIDIIKSVLEILINSITNKNSNSVVSILGNSDIRPLSIDSIEFENVKKITKESKNISTILDLLDIKDNFIRYQASQLLRILLTNQLQTVQQSILISPMGIAKLIDLLRENMEVVRNEALLLFLILTSNANQEIQKIIAFEGVFDILFQIIKNEGLTEGGIVVQDSLQLINNLLKGNISNQNYFRETSCISYLPPLLQLSGSDTWIMTDDKNNIILLTLQIISLLVNTSNPNIHINQSVLKKYEMIEKLIPLALGGINNLNIRIKALQTLADIIYGNKENCSKFSTSLVNISTSSSTSLIKINDSQIPTLTRLLTICLYSKDFLERASAARVFKCYLFENEESQLALASTLTPTPVLGNNEQASIGNQLITALLGWENNDEILPYKTWFASLILESILKDNINAKQLILKIPLEIPKTGVPITTLLTKCIRSLILACKIQSSQNQQKSLLIVKISLLKLLAIWIDNCNITVKSFLTSSPNNLPFLVELTTLSSTLSDPSYQEETVHLQGLATLILGLCYLFCDDETSTSQFNKSSLYNIIVQRIGIDQFLIKLDKLRKTGNFLKAEQAINEIENNLIYPQIKQPSSLHEEINFYDYDFTIFFKNSADKIQKQLKTPLKKLKDTNINNNNNNNNTNNTNNNININNNNKKELSFISKNNNESNILNQQYNESILQSYKELIRQQDNELESLKLRNQELETKIIELEKAQHLSNSLNNNKEKDIILQLKNEIELLKEQLKKKDGINNSISINSQNEYEKMKEKINELTITIDFMNKEKNNLNEQLLQTQNKLKETQLKLQEQESKYKALTKEQEDLLFEFAKLELQTKQKILEDESLENMITENEIHTSDYPNNDYIDIEDKILREELEASLLKENNE